LVWHYRVYRRTGHWLSEYGAKRLEDYLGGNTHLHAHSRDAAQEGFYAACKVARSQQRLGLDMRYPHRRTYYRTTTWKRTGIRVREGALLLDRAKGLVPVRVRLPPSCVTYPASVYKQVQLVWDRVARRYNWHVTVDDGFEAAPALGTAAIAADLGEIHPAALTDSHEAVVITARRLAELQAKQARKQKGSRRWRRLQRCKTRFLAQQKRRARDIEHKVSRAVVDWAVERKGASSLLGMYATWPMASG